MATVSVDDRLADASYSTLLQQRMMVAFGNRSNDGAVRRCILVAKLLMHQYFPSSSYMCINFTLVPVDATEIQRSGFRERCSSMAI